MSSSMCRMTLVTVIWLLVFAAASPVRRSPDLEARRRSAIDRSMVRFGRSFPAQMTAADLRDAFQRSSRRSDSFIRFGRSQPNIIPAEDIVSLLRSYEEYENPVPKRGMDFIRLGRDPQFIRLGKSYDEKANGLEQSSDLVVNGEPQRKGRARDHFLRLGRDSEELNDVSDFDEELEESRRKRSTDTTCHGCQV